MQIVKFIFTVLWLEKKKERRKKKEEILKRKYYIYIEEKERCVGEYLDEENILNEK